MHSADLHLVELDYCTRQLVIGHDARKARLHVGKCPCGADTVRPWEPELVERMADEWGVKCVVDERARARVLAMTYDPIARNDLADGEVWPEVVSL